MRAAPAHRREGKAARHARQQEIEIPADAGDFGYYGGRPPPRGERDFFFRIFRGLGPGWCFELDCGLDQTYTFAALLNNILPRFVTDPCSNRRVLSRDGFSRPAHDLESVRGGQHVTHFPRFPSHLLQKEFKLCTAAYFVGVRIIRPRLCWKTGGPRDNQRLPEACEMDPTTHGAPDGLAQSASDTANRMLCLI